MDEGRHIVREILAGVHERPAMIVDNGKRRAGAHFWEAGAGRFDRGLQKRIGSAVSVYGHGAQERGAERGRGEDGERLMGAAA